MNTINIEQANLFDKAQDYQMIVGMGTLGFSFLGYHWMVYCKAQNVRRVTVFEQFISVNNKIFYFIRKDGKGLSDEKLCTELEQVFEYAFKNNITSIAMNLLPSNINVNNCQFLGKYKNAYRYNIVLDFFNYVTKKYNMDNMNICLCDLHEQILLYDYKPIVQNENNVVCVKSCQKEFVPLQ
jgi:hypothetical protein